MAVCFNILKEATSQFMTSETSEAFLQSVKDLAKEKRDAKSMSQEESLTESINDLMTEQERINKIKKWHAILNLKARANFNEFAKAFDTKSEAIVARLSGTLKYKRAGRESTSLIIKNYREQLAGALYNNLKDAELWDDFENNKSQQIDIANELHTEGSTTNATAKKIAEIVKKDVYQNGRRLLNKFGATIHDLSSFMANQTHNVLQMRRATNSVFRNAFLKRSLIKQYGAEEGLDRYDDMAFERWKGVILPKLDTVKTFKNIEDPAKFLRSAYDAIISGVHLKPELEDLGDIKVFKPANKANNLSASRILHFKDGESWLNYNESYGEGTLAESIYRTVDRMGKNIGLLEHWGPNPRAFFDDIKNRIKTDKKERKNPKIDKELFWAQNIFDQMDGTASTPVDTISANAWNAIRQYISLVKLPLVMISSFGDVAIRASELRDHGVGFLDRWNQIASSSTKNMSKSEAGELATMLRVFNMAKIGDFTSRFAALDSPSGFMSKAMQLFWRYNGMNWWDRNNRESHGILISKLLARQKNKEFEALDPHEQRLFTDYDIGPNEWNFYRKNALKIYGNEKFIAPDMVNFAKDEDVHEYLNATGTKISKTSVQGAKDLLSRKLGSYFIDRVDHAIIQPDDADRAYAIRGTQAGTISGEMHRNIAHFKTFSISFMRKVLGRKWKGGKLQGGKDIAGLVDVMLTTAVMGYISMSTKDIGRGLAPRSPTDWKTWIASILQGGGLGLYGDFLFGDYSRFGQGFLASLLGPEAGAIDDVAGFFSALTHLDHPAEATFRLVSNNTPIINAWFLKTALDYLFIWSLQDWISPGYVNRMQRRIQKKNDQKFIFQPSQYALKPFG